jgi:hypothetical protein
MNMLYETMRGGLASVIVVPSSALESMNLGAIGGLSAFRPGAAANQGVDAAGMQRPGTAPPPPPTGLAPLPPTSPPAPSPPPSPPAGTPTSLPPA